MKHFEVIMKGRGRKQAAEAREPGGRGAVLYIVMLVVVSLAAIGSIGVRSVQFELATSGSVRQATQTRYVAETGAMVGVWDFGSSGKLSAFLRRMDSCQAGEEQFCGEDYWEFNLDDYSGYVPNVFDMYAGPGDYHSLGYAPLTSGFRVLVDNKLPILAVAGYSAAGTNTSGDDYEFQKWTFTSMGSADFSVVDNRANSSETIRATSVLGPVKRER
ncbi:MAG: hypothetical protein ABIJ56_16990 [Pseudomonadota bacterium]